MWTALKLDHEASNSFLVNASYIHLTATSQCSLKAVGFVLLYTNEVMCTCRRNAASCIIIIICIINSVKVVTLSFTMFTCECRHGKWVHYVLIKHLRDVVRNGCVVGKHSTSTMRQCNCCGNPSSFDPIVSWIWYLQYIQFVRVACAWNPFRTGVRVN